MSETPKPLDNAERKRRGWDPVDVIGTPRHSYYAHKAFGRRFHIDTTVDAIEAYKDSELSALRSKLAAAEQEAARLREALSCIAHEGCDNPYTYAQTALASGTDSESDAARPVQPQAGMPERPFTDGSGSPAAASALSDSSKVGGGATSSPQVESAEREPAGTAPGPRLQTCPECKGTGRDLRSRGFITECSRCYGSGTIPAEESR
jgi:hypothetical protein